MKAILRPLHREQLDRLPVTRYAVLLFLLTAALTSAVAVTLVRNANRSTWQQNATALAGGARLGASSFGALRSNLRVQASQLATSLELQRAVVTQNEADLQRIAASHHARITLAGHSVGTLAPQPRIASTATIADRGHVLATITVALPLGKDVLTLLREGIPLPAHSALLLLHDGTVVAGGPIGAHPRITAGHTVLGGDFVRGAGSAAGNSARRPTRHRAGLGDRCEFPRGTGASSISPRPSRSRLPVPSRPALPGRSRRSSARWRI